VTLTARDKVIAALLPALLTLAGYNWLYGRAASQQLSALNARLASAQTTNANESALYEKRRAVELLKKSIATEEEKKKLVQPRATLPSPSRADRSQSLRTLTRQLADSGLTLVKTMRTDTRVSTGQTQTDMAWLAEKQNMPMPEYWRIELLGSYAQMLDALKGLAASSDFIVPLTVEMESANKSSPEGASLQKWTLVVWL
jgi:hypothetical protein